MYYIIRSYEGALARVGLPLRVVEEWVFIDLFVLLLGEAL